MGFCISNQLIWFSSKSAICDPADTGDAETVASSKFGSESNIRNRNKFCGIHPRKRERGLHPGTEERFWLLVLKGRGNSAFKCKPFPGSTSSHFSGNATYRIWRSSLPQSISSVSTLPTV